MYSSAVFLIIQMYFITFLDEMQEESWLINQESEMKCGVRNVGEDIILPKQNNNILKKKGG